MLAEIFPVQGGVVHKGLQKLFYCLIKHFHLGIALGMRWRCFCMSDIQPIHYGETSAAERFNLLQKLRAKAHQITTEQGLKSKSIFDKDTVPHKFKIGDKEPISNDFYVG